MVEFVLAPPRYDVIVSRGRLAFGVTVATESEAVIVAEAQRLSGRVVEIIEIYTETGESALASLDAFFEENK